MARRRIATGIDIGTHHVKVVVVEEVARESGTLPRVIGTGLIESKGLRHGYVVNRAEVAESVRAAKMQAEGQARVPIRGAYLAAGGISLDETRGTGEAIISRADQEITELDVEKAKEAAREVAKPNFLNRRILHEIPLEHRIDGAKALGDPVGMKGMRLAADYLFVTCLAQHADSLVSAVEDADIEVIDQMASPIAASHVLLSRDQKMKGCVLANIGAETVSIVVYDEGVPVSVKVFAEGSTDVTDDLALSFKISLEDAERLKLGKLGGAMYPRRKVESVIAGRFRIMFDLIDKHLKSTGRGMPLPAGIILSGGGAGQGFISDIAKTALGLPSRIADMRLPENAKIRDATWAVAYGLAIWGLIEEAGGPSRKPLSGMRRSFGRFLRQFLP